MRCTVNKFESNTVEVTGEDVRVFVDIRNKATIKDSKFTANATSIAQLYDTSTQDVVFVDTAATGEDAKLKATFTAPDVTLVTAKSVDVTGGVFTANTEKDTALFRVTNKSVFKSTAVTLTRTQAPSSLRGILHEYATLVDAPNGFDINGGTYTITNNSFNGEACAFKIGATSTIKNATVSVTGTKLAMAVDAKNTNYTDFTVDNSNITATATSGDAVAFGVYSSNSYDRLEKNVTITGSTVSATAKSGNALVVYTRNAVQASNSTLNATGERAGVFVIETDTATAKADTKNAITSVTATATGSNYAVVVENKSYVGNQYPLGIEVSGGTYTAKNAEGSTVCESIVFSMLGTYDNSISGVTATATGEDATVVTAEGATIKALGGTLTATATNEAYGVNLLDTRVITDGVLKDTSITATATGTDSFASGLYAKLNDSFFVSDSEILINDGLKVTASADSYAFGVEFINNKKIDFNDDFDIFWYEKGANVSATAKTGNAYALINNGLLTFCNVSTGSDVASSSFTAKAEGTLGVAYGLVNGNFTTDEIVDRLFPDTRKGIINVIGKAVIYFGAETDKSMTQFNYAGVFNSFANRVKPLSLENDGLTVEDTATTTVLRYMQANPEDIVKFSIVDDATGTFKNYEVPKGTTWAHFVQNSYLSYDRFGIEVVQWWFNQNETSNIVSTAPGTKYYVAADSSRKLVDKDDPIVDGAKYYIAQPFKFTTYDGTTYKSESYFVEKGSKWSDFVTHYSDFSAETGFNSYNGMIALGTASGANSYHIVDSSADYVTRSEEIGYGAEYKLAFDFFVKPSKTDPTEKYSNVLQGTRWNFYKYVEDDFRTDSETTNVYRDSYYVITTSASNGTTPVAKTDLIEKGKTYICSVEFNIATVDAYSNITFPVYYMPSGTTWGEFAALDNNYIEDKTGTAYDGKISVGNTKYYLGMYDLFDPELTYPTYSFIDYVDEENVIYTRTLYVPGFAAYAINETGNTLTFNLPQIAPGATGTPHVATWADLIERANALMGSSYTVTADENGKVCLTLDGMKFYFATAQGDIVKATDKLEAEQTYSLSDMFSIVTYNGNTQVKTDYILPAGTTWAQFAAMPNNVYALEGTKVEFNDDSLYVCEKKDSIGEGIIGGSASTYAVVTYVESSKPIVSGTYYLGMTNKIVGIPDETMTSITLVMPQTAVTIANTGVITVDNSNHLATWSDVVALFPTKECLGQNYTMATDAAGRVEITLGDAKLYLKSVADGTLVKSADVLDPGAVYNLAVVYTITTVDGSGFHTTEYVEEAGTTWAQFAAIANDDYALEGTKVEYKDESLYVCAINPTLAATQDATESTYAVVTYVEYDKPIISGTYYLGMNNVIANIPATIDDDYSNITYVMPQAAVTIVSTGDDAGKITVNNTNHATKWADIVALFSAPGLGQNYTMATDAAGRVEITLGDAKLYLKSVADGTLVKSADALDPGAVYNLAVVYTITTVDGSGFHTTEYVEEAGTTWAQFAAIENDDYEVSSFVFDLSSASGDEWTAPVVEYKNDNLYVGSINKNLDVGSIGYSTMDFVVPNSAILSGDYYLGMVNALNMPLQLRESISANLPERLFFVLPQASVTIAEYVDSDTPQAITIGNHVAKCNDVVELFESVYLGQYYTMAIDSKNRVTMGFDFNNDHTDEYILYFMEDANTPVDANKVFEPEAVYDLAMSFSIEYNDGQQKVVNDYYVTPGDKWADFIEDYPTLFTEDSEFKYSPLPSIDAANTVAIGTVPGFDKYHVGLLLSSENIAKIATVYSLFASMSADNVTVVPVSIDSLIMPVTYVYGMNIKIYSDNNDTYCVPFTVKQNTTWMELVAADDTTSGGTTSENYFRTVEDESYVFYLKDYSTQTSETKTLGYYITTDNGTKPVNKTDKVEKNGKYYTSVKFSVENENGTSSTYYMRDGSTWSDFVTSQSGKYAMEDAAPASSPNAVQTALDKAIAVGSNTGMDYYHIGTVSGTSVTLVQSDKMICYEDSTYNGLSEYRLASSCYIYTSASNSYSVYSVLSNTKWRDSKYKSDELYVIYETADVGNQYLTTDNGTVAVSRNDEIKPGEKYYSAVKFTVENLDGSTTLYFMINGSKWSNFIANSNGTFKEDSVYTYSSNNTVVAGNDTGKDKYHVGTASGINVTPVAVTDVITSGDYVLGMSFTVQNIKTYSVSKNTTWTDFAIANLNSDTYRTAGYWLQSSNARIVYRTYETYSPYSRTDEYLYLSNQFVSMYSAIVPGATYTLGTLS